MPCKRKPGPKKKSPTPEGTKERKPGPKKKSPTPEGTEERKPELKKKSPTPEGTEDNPISLADTSDHRASESTDESTDESQDSQLLSPKKDHVQKFFVHANPSYLKTLGQTHSGWIFGAIAELVDNSMDAKATKLEISVETHYSAIDGEKIPMLSLVDDGHGMSHEELIVMLSFGNKRYKEDDRHRVGKFGIGFKTGAMKLGRDVIVITQTTESRSVAFLSQSSNQGNNNLELPVVSYRRNGSIMKVDKIANSEVTADYHLKVIKKFSPFNEFFIGEKLALFGENGHGTQIYIWNLEKFGSEFSLEWQKRNGNKSSSHDDDILIRSRRTRVRHGQLSQKVPLDYSLRSYLEVIFLEPRMKIYLQGSMVKSRPLSKSLNKTKIVNGEIMGKAVQLTLGRCHQEWELMNCGIFLYWHGRLIEAYKKVGRMINSHNPPNMGRGVIGVVDVTDVMRDGDHDLVHNTKQAFQECEALVKLEEWLGNQSVEYWDEHFEPSHPIRKKVDYKPDHEWVQCDKCRKWRRLRDDFDTTSLAEGWLCSMPPYNGKCTTAEEKHGGPELLVNVGSQRATPEGSKRATAEDGLRTPRRYSVRLCSMPPYNGKSTNAEEKHGPGLLVNAGSKRATAEDGLRTPRRLCSMPPYNGKCTTAEEKHGPGLLIDVGSKRATAEGSERAIVPPKRRATVGGSKRATAEDGLGTPRRYSVRLSLSRNNSK